LIRPIESSSKKPRGPKELRELADKLKQRADKLQLRSFKLGEKARRLERREQDKS
jgi:hypothetical protein